MALAFDDPRSRSRVRLIVGAAVAVFLLVAWSVRQDFGLSWDDPAGDLRWGERLCAFVETGDPRFVDNRDLSVEPGVRQPHHDLTVAGYPSVHLYPFGVMVSATFCRVLWTGLGIVPAIEAHHLAVVLFAALALLWVGLFVGNRAGPWAAAGAVVLCAASPRFFAHSMANAKDIPVAALYVLAMGALFTASTRGGKWRWALCGVLAACALASKPNALFIPVQALCWWGACWLVPSVRARRAVAPSWTGVGLAFCVFVATWVCVSPWLWVEGQAGLATRVAELLRISNSLSAAPEARPALLESISLHGLGHALGTTPPVVLGLALAGLCARRVPMEARLFLALGVAVPLGRTMLPGMLNFDGVRHFLEFMPSLAGLAGIGLALSVEAAGRAGHRLGARLAEGRLEAPLSKALPGAVALALVAPQVFATAATHPHGICYFNAFVGGLDGARAAGIVDAGDYWAGSYWQAAAWLNDHAEPDAVVAAPVASAVLEAIRPVRLRADITVLPFDDADLPATAWIVYVVRAGWYGAFVQALERGGGPPAHEIVVQGAPIVRIHRLDGGERARQLCAVRTVDVQGRAARARLAAWLYRHGEHAGEISLVVTALGTELHERAAERLRALLPRDLHGDIDRIADCNRLSAR